MRTEVLNATTSALSNLGSWTSVGWSVTAFVFIFIFLILFLVIRNFKRTVYGSFCSGILLVVYKISRWLGIKTQRGDYVPINWFIYVVVFILLSWLIGFILDKYKIIKKIEKKLDGGNRK